MITALVLAWLHGAALAAPDAAPLVEALSEELDRALTLSLPGGPSPYHVRYHLHAVEQVTAEAAFGALREVHATPRHSLGVEVRVGSPAFDNTGFGGWRNGFTAGHLGVDPTPHAVRLVAWRLTDAAYKDAVEQYARKRAQASLPPDHPGDYTLTGPVVADDGAGPPVADRAFVEALAVAVSAAFLDHPGLDLGEVHVGHEVGEAWVLDTEGTRVRRPVAETSVRAVAHVVAPDGQRLTDERLWTVRDPARLDVHALKAEAAAMAADLVALAGAPAFDGEYVGPVLFEDAAAAALFRRLLLPQLEGTPPEIPFDSFLGEIGGAKEGGRLHRRVLPPGWRVVDDPTADPEHPGSFRHDVEGTPARAVVAVEDGIVRDLFTSRVPRRDGIGSNGHARAALGGRAVGGSSLTTVMAPRVRSERALRRRALALAADYGLDHVLVVRRLQHPALRWLGDPAGYHEDVEGLPPPVAVVRLYRDGREEVLRGARFAHVDRWVLRDLVAAGESVTVDHLAPWNGDETGLGPTEGVPCRLTVPTVLVGELEVLPDRSDPGAVPRLPPPTRSTEVRP